MAMLCGAWHVSGGGTGALSCGLRRSHHGSLSVGGGASAEV